MWILYNERSVFVICILCTCIMWYILFILQKFKSKINSVICTIYVTIKVLKFTEFKTIYNNFYRYTVVWNYVNFKTLMWHTFVYILTCLAWNISNHWDKIIYWYMIDVYLYIKTWNKFNIKLLLHTGRQ